MEETRAIDNDEIVDSIMAVTLQCGLSVEKIIFEGDQILILVKGANVATTLSRLDVVKSDLAWLKKEIGFHD